MKKNKKIALIVLLFIVLVAIIIYAIITTYATFRSEFSGNMEMENATWKIIVNNTDISSQTVKNFTIDKINVDKSEGVEDGKLAPGSKGNFNILIDPTETDVSVKYELKINTEYLDETNIKIESVNETLHSNTLIRTGENTYTGVIQLKDIQNSMNNNIQINIIWEDDENQDMNVGEVPNNQIKIPVELKVSQYLGETIEEYN